MNVSNGTLFRVLILLQYTHIIVISIFVCLECVMRNNGTLIPDRMSSHHKYKEECRLPYFYNELPFNASEHGGGGPRVIHGPQPPRTPDTRKWKTSIILSASPCPRDWHRFIFLFHISFNFFSILLGNKLNKDCYSLLSSGNS